MAANGIDLSPSGRWRFLMKPTANSSDTPEVQKTITLSQDIGIYEPVNLRVTLELMSDGTVRWKSVEKENGF